MAAFVSSNVTAGLERISLWAQIKPPPSPWSPWGWVSFSSGQVQEQRVSQIILWSVHWKP